MNYKINHPIVAFLVIFVLAALLSEYGVVKGTCLIFSLFAGIIIYKFLTFSQKQ
jgi:uncharacterized membrane protein